METYVDKKPTLIHATNAFTESDLDASVDIGNIEPMWNEFCGD